MFESILCSSTQTISAATCSGNPVCLSALLPCKLKTALKHLQQEICRAMQKHSGANSSPSADVGYCALMHSSMSMSRDRLRPCRHKSLHCLHFLLLCICYIRIINRMLRHACPRMRQAEIATTTLTTHNERLQLARGQRGGALGSTTTSIPHA